MPLVTTATSLHALPAPTVDDFGDHDHWGWSYENGSLPGLRNATGIIIEFDIEPGSLELVIQTPHNWWDHPGATSFDGNTLEVVFDEFTADWDEHRIQDRLHISIGNWDSTRPANVVNAWIVGDILRTPYQPDTRDPVLDPPTVDDFGGHDHWGWSTEINTLPLNMSDITGVIFEFDVDSADVPVVVQSPANWWDQPADFTIEDGKLEIVFADSFGDWADHIEQDTIHLVFGNWGPLSPSNVVSATLQGFVAAGIPNPEAGPVVEAPPEGTLPFDMGLGGMIWGDQWAQLGWNGDTRAIDEGAPFAGAGGLSARLLVEAAWFVIYVDNAPNDEEVEMLQLTIFGNANSWSWSGGTMEAPTIQIYDTFVPGAIAFPLGGHPYIDAIRQAGEDELDNRNFGISFQYGSGEEGTGGIETLGITGVWLYADIPAAPPPAPTPEPPPPATPAPPAPTPAPVETSEGLPWWGWVLIAVGVAAVAVVIVVATKKKK
jgi:hypothetical protein